MSDTVPLVNISITEARFDIGFELESLQQQSSLQAGAVVSFSGYVRDETVTGETVETGITDEAVQDSPPKLLGLHLEHYPGMCEKQIALHVDAATARWPLLGVRIIHRVGLLQVGDPIVLVAVSSQHRKAAFEAGEFLMDYLKNEAPIWKRQVTDKGSDWLEAKHKDKISLNKWLQV